MTWTLLMRVRLLKNECLYKEVRYAWMKSTALPKTASFFRLHKSQEVDIPRICRYLIGYRETARTTKTLTIGDLRNVLHALNHVPEKVPENTYNAWWKIPIHLWLVNKLLPSGYLEADKSILWYLCVVDGINSDLTLQVSYMKTGNQWMFPVQWETIFLWGKCMWSTTDLLQLDVGYIIVNHRTS